MDEKIVWKVLNISPTKDENQIKNAYRKELVNNNPEDKPKEFQMLRRAYEEAIILAKKNEQVEEKKKNAVDIWIDKVKQVHNCYEKRIDVESWRELLQDDICIGLDTSLEACEKLLIFLASNYNMPRAIYKEIDKVFSIVDSKKDWYEKFLKEYIDFIESKIKEDNVFAYDLFEDLTFEDASVYDEYIDQYFKIINMSMDAKDLALMKKEIEVLEDMPVSHPFTITEQIHYYLNVKEIEKAKELAAKLEENEEYLKNMRIRTIIASVKLEDKKYQEAYDIFDSILKEESNYIVAEIKIIPCLIGLSRFEEAKTKSVNFLDKYGNVDIVIGYLQIANKNLIGQYEESYKKGDKESLLELGWCYFQNEEFEKCISLLETYEPDSESEFEYCNLKGRCLLANENYEKALGYLLKWRNMFDSLEDDGSKKYKKRMQRMGYSRYVLAMCYSKLVEDKKDKNDEEYIKNNKLAKEELISAIGIEKDERALLHYKEKLSKIHLNLGEYEECIDVTSDIIDEAREYYPAYLNRQEAYFNLKDAQNVVADYNQLVKLVPQLARPYILMIKVLIAFGQIEEAYKVIKLAKKNVSGSDELDLLYARLMYCHNTTKQEIYDVINTLLVLKRKVLKKDSKTDIEDISEIDVRLCMLYIELCNATKALEHIDNAINMSSDQMRYYWIKADILYACEKYREAYSLYEKVSDYFEDNTDFLLKFAECQAVFDVEKAISILEKIKDIKPEHEYINNRIMRYYMYMYEKHYHKSYYEKAIRYAKRQLEINDNACYYISSGMLYLDGDEFDVALDCFNKALEKEPQNTKAYCYKGYTYKRTGDFSKAIEIFEYILDNKFEFEDDENKKFFYECIYSTYFALGRVKEAKVCLCRAVDLFPKERVFTDGLCSVYEYLGENEENIKFFQKKIIATDDENIIIDCLLEMADSYSRMSDYKKATEMYKKAEIIATDKKKHLFKVYSSLGKFYEKYKIRLRKSISYYKMAYMQTKNSRIDFIEAALNIARVSSMLKKENEAKAYYEIAMEAIRLEHDDIKGYLDYAPKSLARYYKMGKASFYAGYLNQAKSYLERMKKGHLCENCKYSACYKAVIGQAMLNESDNDYDEALRLYEKAYEINKSSVLCKNKIAELKKMTRRG